MKIVPAVLRGLVAAAAGTVASGAVGPKPPRPPNVIVILADDLGARDLGVDGSTFHETPHLDRLAARGVRFTAAYAAAGVCSPTRASLLTGRHPARLGITDWLPGRGTRPGDRLVGPALAPHLGAGDRTFAESFRAAGYRTAAIGKWHVGDTPEHFPEAHGFDLNVAGSGKGSPPSYFSPHRLPNLPDGPPGEHLDDRLTREAIAFVRASAEQGKPFLLYLAHYSPHNPLQARPEAVEKYRAKLAAHPPAGPEFSTDGPDGRVRIRQGHPTYAAMVEHLDNSVGTLVGALEELGLAGDTLVIFTSDNGGVATSEGWPTANAPLRAGKGWPYEGGVRVPFIAAWPGRIPAGHVTDAVVTSTDVFPTLLELAGLPAEPAAHVDGRSFASALTDPARSLPERAVFWHYPHYSNQRGRPHGAVRRGAWKLVEWFEDGRTELFDLASDPGETQDLAARAPERAAALLAELRAWREEVGARPARPNPATPSP